MAKIKHIFFQAKNDFIQFFYFLNLLYNNLCFLIAMEFLLVKLRMYPISVLDLFH